MLPLGDPLEWPNAITKIKPLSIRDFTETYSSSVDKESGRVTAAKCLRYVVIMKEKADFTREEKDENDARMRKETRDWVPLHHPNIMPIKGFQWTPAACIVFDWSKHGNIQQFLAKNPSADKIALLSQVAHGLSFLHSHDPPIIHANLKPQNVIINDITGKAMLCDFGMTADRHLAEIGMTMDSSNYDFVAYSAPESFAQDQGTKETDVYAFGSLILEIMSGERPFYKIETRKYASKMQLIAKGETADPADHPNLPATSPLWSVIQACWAFDPSKRPTIEKADQMLLQATKAPPTIFEMILNMLAGIFFWA